MKWEGEAALHILHLLAEWLIFLWETYLYAKLFSTPGGRKDSSFTHSNKKPEKVNHYFGFANLLNIKFDLFLFYLGSKTQKECEIKFFKL